METHRREYTSDLRQVAAMREFVRDACRRVWRGDGPDDEAIGQLVLALNEAATNVIRHAYGGEPGRPIELAVEVDEDAARVSLLHAGGDFDPAAAAAPIFDGSREGGFGLYLISQTVDEVEYTRDERGRCAIRMVKRRLPRRSAMEPEVETVGDVTVVTLRLEQLDASNSEEFREEMAPVLQGTRKLVLDMQHVDFVDSRGCGAILSCLKHVSEAGGDLKLCRVNKPVRAVFELIRLHRICEILPTRDEAVRAFAAHKS
jgi:anti-sigma B factor antagonist